ncbi:Spy/CpxP family protein refolding chaperone [Pseudodesulfovibrio indicus]|nr:periplasmic heavy metal sensor [Pseudodesulfovibrio indicus]
MNTRIIVSSLAALLLFSTVAFGQMMGPGGGPGGPGHHGMWNNYQASPEQQKAYQEIFDKYQGDLSRLADKMWSKRAQLNGLLAQEKVDRKQVKQLADEVGALLSQCYALQVDMLVDMREKGLSYYGMGMMHGGMMGGGMMDMMMGNMMNMMMGGGQWHQGGQWYPGGDRQYPGGQPYGGQPYGGNRGMMQ